MGRLARLDGILEFRSQFDRVLLPSVEDGWTTGSEIQCV